MKDLLRTLVAAAVGAVVAIAVVVGQPALAGQLDKAKAKKVTSAQIKNGTIKTKDLSSEVSGPLAKAGTALQSVPDDSVTTPKLALGAVTSSKIADNSVTSSKIPDGSVTNTDLGDGSVHGQEVSDGTLTLADVALWSTTSNKDFGPIAAGGCGVSNPVETGHITTGNLIFVSQPAAVAGGVQVTAREDQGSSTAVQLVLCNVGSVAFDPPPTTYTFAMIKK